ncbi:hypothetical protein Ancab_011509 [Ancistrocladus abbreviatus]
MRIEQELQLENELEIVEQHEEHVENNDVEIADGVNGQEVLPEGNEDLLEQTHVAVGEDLTTIILNENNQPIGPTKEDVSKFSSILGSVTSNSNLAPIKFHDWTMVDPKEEIWHYVKVEQVFGSICFKDQLKRRYYDPYGDKDERITHCPDNIPED